MKGIPPILLHAAPRLGTEERALGFLRRQNAWFETLLEKLERVASGEMDVAVFLADEPALIEERARYDREAEEVRIAWSKVSGSVPAATRAEIDTLARRGEALVTQLQAAYARLIRDVEKQAADTRVALQTLRSGRNAVRRYAFENPDDATYVDRKA